MRSETKAMQHRSADFSLPKLASFLIPRFFQWMASKFEPTSVLTPALSLSRGRFFRCPTRILAAGLVGSTPDKLRVDNGCSLSPGERVRVRASVTLLLLITLLLTSSAFVHAADYPAPIEGDHIIRDFRFQSGETLPELRMHYRTFGQPARDKDGIVRNAILVLHGTTGNSTQFMRVEFAGELFGQGQLLDASRYFIVIPDNLGHGQSSKPSDGLRARFPRYGYRDMIEAQRRLLVEGVGVDHLRLIIGTSMGGMHTWLWGEAYPDFMDALMPLASLPTQISGRNRVWRRVIIDAIRTDPEWQEGNYQTQPRGMRLALEMSYFMGNNPVQRLKEAPTLAAADAALPWDRKRP